MARKNLNVFFREVLVSESMLPNKHRYHLTSSDLQLTYKPPGSFLLENEMI